MTQQPWDKIHYMRRTTLTKEQLLRNAEAMVALANDQEVQYWSPVTKKWTDSPNVDSEFEHRVKPVEAKVIHSKNCEIGNGYQDCPACLELRDAVVRKPTVSTNAEDY